MNGSFESGLVVNEISILYYSVYTKNALTLLVPFVPYHIYMIYSVNVSLACLTKKKLVNVAAGRIHYVHEWAVEMCGALGCMQQHLRSLTWRL